MTCASCAARVEKTLRDTPGVTRAYVNFATERATVAFDPGRVTLDGLTQRVAGAGYGARPAAAATGAAGEADRLREHAGDVAARTGRLRRRFTAAMAAGGVVSLLSLPLMSMPGGVHDPMHALMAPVEAFFRALLPALYAAPRRGAGLAVADLHAARHGLGGARHLREPGPGAASATARST